MNNDKIKQFMSNLSKGTLSGNIHWKRVTDFGDLKPESNKPIFNLLFQSEFRHLDLDASYYAIVSNGEIYLLNEVNESGRDGTITSGYRMYLHSEGSTNILHLQCNSGSIYQLINSIHVYLADQEKDLESFIDDFLSQNSSYSNQ